MASRDEARSDVESLKMFMRILSNVEMILLRSLGLLKLRLMREIAEKFRIRSFIFLRGEELSLVWRRPLIDRRRCRDIDDITFVEPFDSFGTVASPPPISFTSTVMEALLTASTYSSSIIVG